MNLRKSWRYSPRNFCQTLNRLVAAGASTFQEAIKQRGGIHRLLKKRPRRGC